MTYHEATGGEHMHGAAKKRFNEGEILIREGERESALTSSKAGMSKSSSCATVS